MKTIKDYINENVASIFEMSDELLQRAIDKSMQQNTALTRRRAKEFEKWMNDPRHKELEELAKNTKEKRILLKAKTDYFDVAIEAINNKDRKVAADNFEKYFKEWDKAISSQTKFGKIKVETGKTGVIKYYSSKYRSEYYVSQHDLDWGTFSRKRDNSTIYNDTIGIELFFTLDDDEKVLNNHDYRKEFKGFVAFSFYKSGKFSAYSSVPYYVFPPSYKDDYKNMYEFFKNTLGISFKEPDGYGVFGAQDLNDRLDIKTIIENNFFSNIEKDDIEDVLKKFSKVLQDIDPKCKVEKQSSNQESVPSNYWIGAAQQHWTKDTAVFKLTFCGKEHILASNHSHGIMGNSLKISFDDIERGLTASREDWGDGIWMGGSVAVSDEVCELLEKDRK